MSKAERRWEILIPNNQYEAFRDLMFDLDLVDTGPPPRIMIDVHWVICYPSVEFKIIAKLKFNIEEIPPYGTEIDFTD